MLRYVHQPRLQQSHDSYMEWLINTFDEPKREDLSYLNNQIQLSIYAEPEVVNDIGKAALAGHTDHAAIMAGEIGLMDEEVVELRARVCMFCDMWDNALRFIEDYHSQMHFSEWLFEFAADVMYRMNKTDKLDELCKAWTGHGYDRINLHLNRARVLCMKGFLKEGLDIAEAILLLEPTHSLTHLLRGNILATRRLHDDAIGAFKQGLKYGDDPLLRLGLAKSLYATGKRRQAQRLRDELVADGVGAKILAGLQ